MSVITPEERTLEELFIQAENFVKKHYPTNDQRDKNIKILATMNQLIELRKTK